MVKYIEVFATIIFILISLLAISFILGLFMFHYYVFKLIFYIKKNRPDIFKDYTRKIPYTIFEFFFIWREKPFDDKQIEKFRAKSKLFFYIMIFSWLIAFLLLYAFKEFISILLT